MGMNEPQKHRVRTFEWRWIWSTLSPPDRDYHFESRLFFFPIVFSEEEKDNKDIDEASLARLRGDQEARSVVA